MKLSEGFEYKGYWWRPSAPDKKVAGVLTYKAGDKILLELIGAFGGSEDAITAFMNKRDEDIIYGTLENAKNVTHVRGTGGRVPVSRIIGVSNNQLLRMPRRARQAFWN